MCVCQSSPSLIELEIPYNQLQGSLLNATLITKEPSGYSGARVSFYAERTLQALRSLLLSFSSSTILFTALPMHQGINCGPLFNR